MTGWFWFYVLLTFVNAWSFGEYMGKEAWNMAAFLGVCVFYGISGMWKEAKYRRESV